MSRQILGAEQLDQAVTSSLLKLFQAKLDHDSVLISHRHEIRYCADSHKIKQMDEIPA